uniref:Beta/delta/mu-theraphotoxin-Pv1 n=1 Tax=Poecilotheria vittata TaxID=2053141 RepID=TX1_POEVT|nr:RecName: Full=Beta/delta/mu-theraphotoxin-Pv1; AltName: Full=Beta/delta/mu-TRTX-Pv1; AltName: Full=Poecilotheriatoxin-1; Short=PcaTX-1 [Poecilotheria vittata]
AGCKYLFGSCKEDSDCCKHLGCRRKAPQYCGWDGTF